MLSIRFRCLIMIEYISVISFLKFTLLYKHLSQKIYNKEYIVLIIQMSIVSFLSKPLINHQHGSESVPYERQANIRENNSRTNRVRSTIV